MNHAPGRYLDLGGLRTKDDGPFDRAAHPERLPRLPAGADDPRERLLEKARAVYRSYGFAPIDTPALEYAEILLGKMGAEAEIQRQLYRFIDHGGRDVALRFDLTVPFARFAAQHIGKLGTPFKRYDMGPVWRGETPQAGRFREFWQCDFDTIGTESNASDIETALVIHDLMRALGFERFEVRINNRLVLNGLLEELGLAERRAALLRGAGQAAQGRPRRGAGGDDGEGRGDGRPGGARAGPGRHGGDQRRDPGSPGRDFGGNAKAAEGMKRLRELLDVARTAGVPEERLRLDLSIARGLDYYTGTIYETFLLDLPKIGSVCSGGRYDNLAGLYTKQHLPGVGASLGLDRLLAAMEELELLPKTATPAPVLVMQFSPDRLGEYQKMARALRAEGIGVEVYPGGEEGRPAVQVRRAARLSAGPDRRAGRIRPGRVEDQGPGPARGNDRRGGGGAGRGAETAGGLESKASGGVA